MTTLKPFDFGGSAGTGSEFMRVSHSTDPTGAAMQSLGGQLAKLGAGFNEIDQQLAAKAEADAKRLERIEAENNYTRWSGEMQRQMIADAENMPESGSGFAKSVSDRVAGSFNDYMKNVPEALRPEMEHKFLQERERIITRAAEMEYGQRRQFANSVMQAKGTALSEAVYSGWQTPQSAVADIDATVDGMKLAPMAAENMKRSLRLKVDDAVVKRGIDTNPSGTLRDIQRYVPGAISSGNPSKQLDIEAAQRHGIDPMLSLIVTKVESGGDHNMDMSKVINKATGKPTSTAFGKYQMIDANWAEVGMQKSADPAIQSEAGARLLRMRIDTLQRNGIEASPENVWGMHLLGPSGFLAVQAAAARDPNTPFRDVYSKFGEKTYRNATTGNGELLKDGMTVGQVLANIKGRVDSVKADVSKDIVRSAPVDPNQRVVIGGQEMSSMVAADIPAYISKANAAVMKAGEEAMKQAAQSSTQLGFINGYDPGHRDLANKGFQQMGVGQKMLGPDMDAATQAAGQSQAFASRHGFIPPDAARAAENMITSPDPARKALGFETLLQAHAADPIRGLEHSGITPDMRRRVETYGSLRDVMKLDAKSAIAMTEKIYSPENQKRMQTPEFQQLVKDGAANFSFSKIQSAIPEMRTGFALTRMFGYGEDLTPRQEKTKDLLTELGRESFKHHMSYLGDEKAAEAAALTDVKRALGVQTKDGKTVMNITGLFGRREVGLFPPEAYYPKGPDGSFKWIEEQAVAIASAESSKAAKEGAGWGKVDPKNIYLRPTGDTWRDLRLGQQPRYDVLYVNGSTVHDVARGWRPNAAFNPTPGEVQGFSEPRPQTAPAVGALAAARKKAEARRETVVSPMGDAPLSP